VLDAQGLAGAGKEAGAVGAAVVGQYPPDADSEGSVVGNSSLQEIDGRGFLFIRMDLHEASP
jgi:hypothetical protein